MSMCTIRVHVKCIHVCMLCKYMYPYTHTYANLHISKGKPMDELHDALNVFVNFITGPHKAL